MGVSSAPREHNFSEHGFVHSKLRNSLTHEKVKKMVFVKENIKHVCPEVINLLLN